MKPLFDLYAELHNEGACLFDRPLPFSAGAKSAVVEVDGAYGVFLDVDRLQDSAEETVLVAHECGHIKTGATHRVASPLDLVCRHEERANRWAIRRLLPKDDLEAALRDGCTEPWQLAERFGVTVEFVRRALDYYAVCGSTPAPLPDEGC